MRVVHKSDPVAFTGGTYSPPFRTSAIFVGAAGDVVARLRGDGAARTWKVAASQYLLGDFAAVTEAGTTATSLIAITDRTE